MVYGRTPYMAEVFPANDIPRKRTSMQYRKTKKRRKWTHSLTQLVVASRSILCCISPLSCIVAWIVAIYPFTNIVIGL